MANLIDKAKEYQLSRRKFLGVTAAAAGTATVATLPGGLTKVDQILAEEATSKAEEGKWVTAACWHNCGGRCLNKAYVMDGVVIRQKTDDTHPDSPDFPQQRACVRGRAQRKQVFAADRLKYPMKRKHWEPGGGNKELRGHDEWVRISWDEALDILASEIKRIKEQYGNRSILVTGGEANRALNLYGGFVDHWNTISWGSWLLTGPTVGLQDGFDDHSTNDRLDLRNSQLVVMWGVNPAWSSGGSPSYNFLQAKKAGARFICIDPAYTDTAELLEAEWIPIRPGTDHAMLLGMAYTLIKEDDPALNPLIDWDFLNRCTIGFDQDHMPEGADQKDNFKDYVLGTYDGIPKTPEWASEICGIDPARIRSLAVEVGATNRVALLTGWSCARIQNGDSLPQMFMTLGAMTGHMGQPGRMTGVSSHYATGNGGYRLVKRGGGGLPPTAPNPVDDSINDGELWSAILDGKYTAGKDDIRDINIQMIYHGYNAILQTTEGMAKGIEAHRKVEFVVSHAQFLTTNAKYSDLVLPVTTEWEREGGLLHGNREAVFFYTKVTEPLYESKPDWVIVSELGKRLGIDPDKMYGGISEKQQLFNKLATTTVINEAGTDYEPLVTITPQDIQEWGVEGKPQKGRITLKEFQEAGVYQVPRKPGDHYGYIAQEAFRKDPEANPLSTTATGKMEIYSKNLADIVEGYGWGTIKPIPTYTPAIEGYQATFSDWENKVKGEYPLQVYNPHYLRRSHSIFDNVTWLREAWPNPVFLSAKDAKERGIKSGDTVLITSPHGKTLRIATVTERLMPGIVGLPHGAWVNVDEKTGIDHAGADNYIVGACPTGQGVNGYNSCIAQVEKWTGKPLEEDVKRPQRIIFE